MNIRPFQWWPQTKDDNSKLETFQTSQTPYLRHITQIALYPFYPIGFTSRKNDFHSLITCIVMIVHPLASSRLRHEWPIIVMGTKVNLRYESLMHVYLDWQIVM